MKELVGFAADEHGDGGGEFLVTEAQARAEFPVDVVVGTPMKLMEMVRGRGWERGVQFGGGPAAEFERKRALEADAEGGEKEKERGPKRRRGRDLVPGVGTWKASAEMGLAEVEWVVVDEADVLSETTRMLLADIAKARGREVPFISLPVGLLAPTPKPEPPRQTHQSAITPLNYPFNFLVTSATIPHSLSAYLNAYHPALQRLVSPNLHRLPKSLKTEYVSWTGGSKNADIERRLRKVLGDMSKVLIFCNKNNKVDELGTFLDDKGIKNVQLSGRSPNRKRGSNAHLEGFIKPRKGKAKEKRVDDWSASWVADEDADAAKEARPATTTVAIKPKGAPRALVPLLKQGMPPPPVINDPMNVPHVMITTSLLSRGLDFSPNIKYVFIIDEPRNMIDFLHRAGRTARAGANGRVVIFGKTAGRGSQRSKEVKQRIKALVA
ncbi:P-loop containing nucleoside triphosphate hydrolase protein [Mycena olivaceomarginata]|nr:P-loop containing nucleoside triphosphate hydrolase protein [Mycena olivaceomarginata]